MFRPLSLAAIVLLAVMTCFSGTAFSAAPASSPGATKALPPLSSGGERSVQIFDVAAGQVVRTLDNSAEFQAVARQWLHDVQGMSPNFTPDDSCGYVFRIPLKDVHKVKLEKASFEVQEVFLFYCRGREPEMLAFDLKNKPYLLRVNTDLRPFLALAGFEPKS